MHDRRSAKLHVVLTQQPSYCCVAPSKRMARNQRRKYGKISPQDVSRSRISITARDYDGFATPLESTAYAAIRSGRPCCKNTIGSAWMLRNCMKFEHASGIPDHQCFVANAQQTSSRAQFSCQAGSSHMAISRRDIRPKHQDLGH